MNINKIILLVLFSIVLIVSIIGAIFEYIKHKRIRRLIGSLIGLLLIYGSIIYLAYNG